MRTRTSVVLGFNLGRDVVLFTFGLRTTLLVALK